MKIYQILLGLSLFFPVHADAQILYPDRWFKPVPESEKASWEILPQEAGEGEVILSKRNDLGILSNFAATPFILDGKSYASVEGFWQMMFYPENDLDPRSQIGEWQYTRDHVANMTGFEAKNAGKKAKEICEKKGIDWISYQGKKIYYKGADQEKHYELIYRAMMAKLEQNPDVKKILLFTGNLKLKPDHKQPPDKTKAYDYHLIWMDIRKKIKKNGQDSGLLAHWDENNRKRIIDAVEKSKGSEKKAAVFDADGTLWHADAPREFLEFLVRKKALKYFDYTGSPVQRLYSMCEKDVSICIAQAGFLMVGISVEEMKKHIAEFYKDFDKRVFTAQQELIRYLHENGFSVYIVSGGMKMLACFGAGKYFNISEDKVIALQLKIVNEVISTEVIPPVPFSDGKVKAIKEFIPEDILISVGNTKSDIPMLELAKVLAITVNSFKKEEKTFHYESEQKLIEEARKKEWIIQGF
jgi:phosphoserine phosphatase/predicted NAD-dependent protein-ADP-ribosyltransferase YbiA (DUF1768 family)